MSKEKEDRVRLELRVTELEDEMEMQTSRTKSARCVLYMYARYLRVTTVGIGGYAACTC